MKMNQYLSSIAALRDTIPEDRRSMFDRQIYRTQRNPVVVFGFSLWLGWLGIDRFQVGQVGRGIAKLILGIIGLGMDDSQYGAGSIVTDFYDAHPYLYVLGIIGMLWYLVDWFRIGGITRAVSFKNIEKIASNLIHGS